MRREPRLPPTTATIGGSTGVRTTAVISGRIGFPVTTAPRSGVPGSETAGRAPRLTAIRLASPGCASDSCTTTGIRRKPCRHDSGQGRVPAHTHDDRRAPAGHDADQRARTPAACSTRCRCSGCIPRTDRSRSEATTRQEVDRVTGLGDRGPLDPSRRADEVDRRARSYPRATSSSASAERGVHVPTGPAAGDQDPVHRSLVARPVPGSLTPVLVSASSAARGARRWPAPPPRTSR